MKYNNCFADKNSKVTIYYVSIEFIVNIRGNHKKLEWACRDLLLIDDVTDLSALLDMWPIN